MRFIQAEVASRGLRHASVLEVGSLNVNGSARQFFDGPYVGIDMQDGPGVDIVMNAHDLNSASLLGAPFDVIVCTEMLEHDDLPWISLENMAEQCETGETGATLLLTCRGFDQRGAFKYHEHPYDMYRFSVPAITALLQHTGWTPELVTPDPTDPGVFAVART